jgi:hypothetical protein
MRTRIAASDFETFVSEVTRDIWNKVVTLPQFYSLKPEDYPALRDLISSILHSYRK